MKISIIVHTWDPYEDCWDPFFILFKKYWPNFEGTIYINTERKDYSFDGLNVVSLKVGLSNNPKQLPLEWSERLIRGLNEIDDDIVLYMQEDYFFKDYVKNDLVLNYLSFIRNSDIDCVHLTDQVAQPLLSSEKKHNLYLSNPNSRDLVCCQAAFWRKSSFLKVLKKNENGWELEEYGSQRAKYMNMKFYTPDRNYVILDKFEIIPYIFTGIVSGKWHRQVPKLFKENNIKIDFSKRGMAGAINHTTLKKKLQNKIKRIILRFICWKDIFIIKYFKGNK